MVHIKPKDVVTSFGLFIVVIEILVGKAGYSLIEKMDRGRLEWLGKVAEDVS